MKISKQSREKLGKIMKNGDKWCINYNDDDGDDEPDKIPTHHLGLCLLGFCPLGFILHTWQNSDWGETKLHLDRSFPFWVLPAQVGQAEHSQANGQLGICLRIHSCQYCIYCIYYPSGKADIVHQSKDAGSEEVAAGKNCLKREEDQLYKNSNQLLTTDRTEGAGVILFIWERKLYPENLNCLAILNHVEYLRHLTLASPRVNELGCEFPRNLRFLTLCTLTRREES